MSHQDYLNLLKAEVDRIDQAGSSKRQEKIILGFTDENPPRAVIDDRKYYVFNSNDYLGLKYNADLKEAEHEASKKYGAGPGAVRFISGSLKVHRDLEQAVARFHGRDDAILYSSAFAANLGTIFPLIVGQAKTSLVRDNVLVISDELNHRSIIDSIRLANLAKENRAIFKHLDLDHLETILKEAASKYDRAVVITDGVFSMLGELQDLKRLHALKEKYDQEFKHGILTIVDDAHGVGAIGETGRGTEEDAGERADVLIGTFGKAFGSDGGYVAAGQTVIDYLRESSATYIYSNPIPPSTAGAALAALELMDTDEGRELTGKLADNIRYFKEKAKAAHIPFAADSRHPVQPVLIGDTLKTKQLVGELFTEGFLTTAISYPVVPPGRDEIRVQINAVHTPESIDLLIGALAKNIT